MQKKQAIALTFDAAFKMYFKQKEELLKPLLQNFLPLPEGSVVEDVKLLDTELTRNDPEKTFVLDMRVKIARQTADGIFTEVVDVEMQSTSEPYFSDRLLAYSARLYSDQLLTGEKYDKLDRIYCLAFTPYLEEFKPIQDQYYHVCSLRREMPPYLTFSHGMKFIVVELDKFMSSVDKILDIRDAWCYLLKLSHKMDRREFEVLAKKDKNMAKAIKHLWNLSEDELTRERLRAIEKERLDQVTRESYYREKSREEGIEEGMERGIEEGMEKGMEKGREEGMEKKQKEIALNLLKARTDIQTICQCTGMTEAEVRGLEGKK